MVKLTPRASNSPNLNFVGKKSFKRVTLKPETDILDATEYQNCSVPIIREASNRETWKPKADIIESKPQDYIGNNTTLTRQSRPYDVSHQSKNKHPHGNMKHTLTTPEANSIDKNITTLAQFGETSSKHHDKAASRECIIPKTSQ